MILYTCQDLTPVFHLLDDQWPNYFEEMFVRTPKTLISLTLLPLWEIQMDKGSFKYTLDMFLTHHLFSSLFAKVLKERVMSFFNKNFSIIHKILYKGS